jgi:hypothetical protein
LIVAGSDRRPALSCDPAPDVYTGLWKSDCACNYTQIGICVKKNKVD